MRRSYFLIAATRRRPGRHTSGRADLVPQAKRQKGVTNFDPIEKVTSHKRDGIGKISSTTQTTGYEQLITSVHLIGHYLGLNARRNLATRFQCSSRHREAHINSVRRQIITN